MTSQTGSNRQGWRRVVMTGLAVSAVVAGAIAGVGAPAALADPADPTPTQPEISPEMSADEALAIIAKDYDMGAGGGQLSTLIHQALQLRNLGFKASNANRQAIAKALEQRPNQGPLIEALKETIAYQRKLQAQMQNANAGQQPGFNFGVGQPPPGMGPALPPGVPPNPGDPNGGVFIGVPGATVNQPVG
jgi:hypothetical protein